MALWDASLRASEQGQPQADVLHTLGSDIFQLIQGNCDPAHLDVTRYIQGLCRAGKLWARLGNTERASWCVGHAVRYAERLEALMASRQLPQDPREGCVLQLFELYLQAAQDNATSKQQSVANNMLARALQLSKHEAVGPATSCQMAVSIAELQLEQAKSMLERDAAATALVLLQSAQQHLNGILESNNDRNGGNSVQLKRSLVVQGVALAAAEAHLACGDSHAAIEQLERLQSSGPWPSGWFSAADRLMVRALVATGDARKAAQRLCEANGQDPESHAKEDEVQAWREAFTLVQGAWRGAEVAPAELIAAAVWYTCVVGAAPEHMVPFIRCLLSGAHISSDHSRVKGHTLALQILAANEIVASICKDAKVQQACHSMLRALAGQLYSEGSYDGCASILSAVFQYAPTEQRAAAAGLQAVCHLHAGRPKQALQYLAIAAGCSAEGSAWQCLVKCLASIESNDPDQAIFALRAMTKCADFHSSLVEAALQVADLSDSAQVKLEAAVQGVKAFIPEDGGPSRVDPGQEAAILFRWLAAMLQIATYVPVGLAPMVPDVYDQLATGLKLSTKRLKILGVRHFAREAKHLGSLAVVGHNACYASLEASSFEPCVTIASSTHVLLEEVKKGAGSHKDRVTWCNDLQARVLLCAVQAMIVAAQHTASPGTHSMATQLGRARKLLKQAEAAAKGVGGNACTACSVLQLELAVLQGNSGDGAAAVAALRSNAADLTVRQQECLIRCAMGATGAVRQAVFALLASVAGLALVPQLWDLCSDAEFQLHICQRAAGLLTSASSDESIRDASRQATAHWLAAKAFNAGVAQAMAGTLSAARGFFQLVCELGKTFTEEKMLVELQQRAAVAMEEVKQLEGTAQQVTLLQPARLPPLPSQEGVAAVAAFAENEALSISPKSTPHRSILTELGVHDDVLLVQGVPADPPGQPDEPPMEASRPVPSPVAVAAPSLSKLTSKDPIVGPLRVLPPPDQPSLQAPPTAEESFTIAASTHSATHLAGETHNAAATVEIPVAEMPSEPAKLSRLAPALKPALASIDAAKTSAQQRGERPSGSQTWLNTMFAAQNRMAKPTKRKFVPPRPAGAGSAAPSMQAAEDGSPHAAGAVDDADMLSIDSVE